MNSTNSSHNPRPRLKPDVLRIVTAGALAVTASGGLLHWLMGIDPAAAIPKFTLCPFKALTSLPCPGCGMTHAFLALGRLDFAAAFAYNPLSFPLAALMMLYAAGKIPRQFHYTKVSQYALLAVLAFWEARLLR